MADTLIKVDLTQPAPSNPLVHNRWHPDIPIAVWVKPGDDFILETYDWTGGYIKNNDSADDVRDVDLTTVHYLSGPVGVQGAEPGDLLARIFHRSRATNEDGIALVCPKIQVSNLDQRAGNAEAKLYRRN